MTEIGKKKRRIARIGGMSVDKEATKSHTDDGSMEADCNLVYNIMQSMNKSQDIMSYTQLQEYRSKEKAARTINSEQNSSSKQNGKVYSSKPAKKFVPEKSHPLMKKCQKSMKYLKKNRCIPKPRAHVGFIPRPSSNPSISLQPNNICNTSSISNSKSIEDSSMKARHSLKQTSSPAKKKRKKTKFSHSQDKPCDINETPKESFDKKTKFINDVDTDSDSDFEQFLRKHQPEKSVHRKSEKRNEIKRKKNKRFVCAKKVAKVTNKILSASEDSSESKEESDEFPSKKFQRIVDYENSSNSGTDTHVIETGTLNCDSFSSSEDESMINKSLNRDNCVDFNDSVRSITLLAEQSGSSEREDTLSLDAMKAKCKIPCYVVIKRDPLLDKNAASLQHFNNSVISNIAPISNPCDEDDCIIIETSTNNFAIQKSNNIATSLEKRNSTREEFDISKSPHLLETSNNNDIPSKHTLNQELTSSSSRLKPQTDTISNGKSADIFHGSNSMPLEMLNNEKVSGAVTASNKSTSVVNSSSLNTETNISLNCDRATEKEIFSVQILSVQSLNDSDIIVLSDHDEDTEAVPAMDEAKQSATDDSDIEIICLDSSVANKEKCENAKVIMNSKAHNEVKAGVKEDSNGSLASIRDDCIILDDLDLPSENTCPPNKVNKEQQSSQVNVINNVKTNFNESAKTSSGNTLQTDKDAILKTLGTIDFNCINKVLNETTATGTQKTNIPTKVENSLRVNAERTPDSFPEKLKQTQNDSNLSQKQALIDTRITPVGPFEVNIKISSFNTAPVAIREKHPNLLQNCNTSNSGSENVPNSLRRNSIPISSDKSSAIDAKPSAPKSFVSERKGASSCKTEPDTLNDSRKIQQLLPKTKVDSYESPSDELDVIAAKSIQSLNDKERESIVPLLELYRTEYKRFMEIKCTEQNVTAGLKLLEDKQAKRLLAISSSIKNIVKKDECFHKINKEFGNKALNKSDSVEKDGSLDEIKKPFDIVSRPSINSYPDVEKDDKVKIFNKSVVERASEVLKADGPSSSQEVYNHLINSVCAECGKHAVAACSGCAKIFFCSEKCGLASWNKGHFATCRR